MKVDEAVKKICPMMSDSKKTVKCLATDCTLWIQSPLQKDSGRCGLGVLVRFEEN